MLQINDLKVEVSESDHVLGSPAAAVTLVEYGDYECPDCLNSEPMVRQLREFFGDKLRVIFRHFPMNSVHANASAAAQAAEAAAHQGKFWEMHEALFRHQKELADMDLTHLGLTLGLDPYKFQTDAESKAVTQRVREHLEGGLQSGVTGTPTFFINGVRHEGATDLGSLRGRIAVSLKS